jgi:hypothetical protein
MPRTAESRFLRDLGNLMNGLGRHEFTMVSMAWSPEEVLKLPKNKMPETDFMSVSAGVARWPGDVAQVTRRAEHEDPHCGRYARKPVEGHLTGGKAHDLAGVDEPLPDRRVALSVIYSSLIELIPICCCRGCRKPFGGITIALSTHRGEAAGIVNN